MAPDMAAGGNGGGPKLSTGSGSCALDFCAGEGSGAGGGAGMPISGPFGVPSPAGAGGAPSGSGESTGGAPAGGGAAANDGGGATLVDGGAGSEGRFSGAGMVSRS